MSTLRLMGIAIIAGHLACAADGPARASATGTVTIPKVLRSDEPVDSRIVTLPGAPKPAPKVLKKFDTEAVPDIPVPEPPKPESLPDAPVPAPAPRPSPELAKLTTPSRPFLPPDLQKEVAVFCQKLIGQWTEEDAEQLLGKPLRNRPAFDDKKAVNGKIYAFFDPTGRYRELELDFDQASNTLRTVFAYPKALTWLECRRRWNGEVSEANAQQGRTFYSYLNRRLDVLVDAKGKVISLGLY